MPLLRDGTVLGNLYFLRDQDPTNDVLSEGSSSCDVAPIEDVTLVAEGLHTAITFTFAAVEGEDTQPSSPSSGAGYTILCAEDNAVNQRLLWKVFGKFGQDCVITENGQEAFDAYKASPERFPCIFMDLMMPVMGGREATSRIRAFESTRPGHRRALIVGLVTSNGDGIDMSTIPAMGFDLVLYKPIRVHELHEMFMGGPQTNIVTLYGSLTEEEKRAYPRLVAETTALGDDPRSNAIRKELARRIESGWILDSGRNPAARFTKIIVNVVEAGEYERSKRI